MHNEKLIHLGSCRSAHGIKGEFVFHLFNQESKQLKVNSEILIKKIDQNFFCMKIENIRYGNKTIVSFESITSRSEAERLIPFEIYLKRTDLLPLLDGEYYLNDLIGLKVYSVESGECAGPVVDFYENGPQVVLVVKTNSGMLDLLFIDVFVRKIDLEKGVIEAILPEYVD